MKAIPLTRGLFAIVDDEDFPELSKHRWHARWDKSCWYAARGINRMGKNGKRGGITIYMHRVITQTPRGMHTDHINGNGLDNRRCNLRIATYSQNRCNVHTPVKNITGYRGVYMRRGKTTTYRVSFYVTQDGRRIRKHGGIFTDPIEAARASDKIALELFGKFAILNFPMGENDK